MELSDKLEQEFEEIAQEAIEKAEQVDCSLPEFAAGMRSMMISLRERAEIAESEAGE